MTRLDALKAGRELLDKSYVPWVRDDGKGGHCHYGVIYKLYIYDVETYLDDITKELYPELEGLTFTRYVEGSPHGEEARRLELSGELDHYKKDIFDRWPAVTVNNQLGKEAILKVWDAAIAREEANQ